MEAAQRPFVVDALSLRNTVYLIAVVLMNYTISRPSPVDITFLLAFALSIFVNQRIPSRFFLFFILVFIWLISSYISSIDVMYKSDVQHEIYAKTFVVILGIGSCYVSTTWDQRMFERFLKVYIASCTLAATLGIIGYVIGTDQLTWDGRATGLIDDPNMFGTFLLPGMLGCLYFFSRGQRGWLAAALFVILIGILLAFSRAAVGAALVCGGLYVVFLNRRDPLRAVLWILLGLLVAALLVGLASVLLEHEHFLEKVMDRLTVAKSYDLGHTGRYSRYLLAMPMIMANPLGIGLLEIDKYFPEPIHNMTISSFLNYGWVAGADWISLIVLSARIAWVNFRRTRHPLVIFLGLSFLAQFLGSSLHEGEHWRHLWLYLGLLWGFNPRLFQSHPALDPINKRSPPSTARTASSAG